MKKKKKPAGLKRNRPSAKEASLNNEIVWNYVPSFNHHQNSTETSNWANKYYFGTSHSDHSTSEHTCSSFLFKKNKLASTQLLKWTPVWYVRSEKAGKLIASTENEKQAMGYRCRMGMATKKVSAVFLGRAEWAGKLQPILGGWETKRCLSSPTYTVAATLRASMWMNLGSNSLWLLCLFKSVGSCLLSSDSALRLDTMAAHVAAPAPGKSDLVAQCSVSWRFPPSPPPGGPSSMGTSRHFYFLTPLQCDQLTKIDDEIYITFIF